MLSMFAVSLLLGGNSLFSQNNSLFVDCTLRGEQGSSREFTSLAGDQIARDLVLPRQSVQRRLRPETPRPPSA